MTDPIPSPAVYPPAPLAELKRCPFCGCMPVTDRIEPHKHYIAKLPDYPGSWSIECVSCEFQIFSHESIDDAASKWNRRAP